MSEIIKLDPMENNLVLSGEQGSELATITENLLLDARASIKDKAVMTMPIAEISTLGSGVSSLLPTFRTVTETTTVKMDNLYRLANAEDGDVLKLAKNGDYWPSFKQNNGKSKLARLQSVDDVTSTTKSVAAVNPATVMMAVALYSIEQRLGDIERMEKEILAFLETEKESQIEGDIETLSAMIIKHKHNWDNELCVANHHKLAIDIQRTARQNMILYQKQVADGLSEKKLFVSQSKVNDKFEELLRKFKYYRLTLYSFAMASFAEVMLSGNFKAENILLVKTELEKFGSAYQVLFCQCSEYLEKLSASAVETNVIKVVGSASKAVGRFVDSIPKVRNGQIDEFFLDSGAKFERNATKIERSVVDAFAEIGNSGVQMFVEKLNDVDLIYNHTEEIYFDDKQIYLVAE